MAYISGESGKTHLACIFVRLLNGALIQSPSGLPRDLLEGLDCVAIDSVDDFDEQWLFDAFNILKERNAYALFTSKRPVQNFILSDLRSRMMSIPSFKLGELDDELMRNVAIKRFSDLGMSIDDDSLTYLLMRIPRSFTAINEWVTRLDESSSMLKRKISRSMIRGLLDEVGNER
jgi:chromosomal replication initiation ATPase DnaA